MSVAGITSNLPQAITQSFLFQRRTNFVRLGQEINSGDLAGAQPVYSALTTLGQNTDGFKPFKSPILEQDFLAVGQALRTGDTGGAQKAYATLQQDIQRINFGGKLSSQVQPRIEAFILELIPSRENSEPRERIV